MRATAQHRPESPSSAVVAFPRQTYPRTPAARLSSAQPVPTGKRFARRFEAWGGEQAPSVRNVWPEVLGHRLFRFPTAL